MVEKAVLFQTWSSSTCVVEGMICANLLSAPLVEGTSVFSW